MWSSVDEDNRLTPSVASGLSLSRASLILAICFLTLVPVPGRDAAGPGALRRAAWWFRTVGPGLRAGLVLVDRPLARAFPPLLAALLVVSMWSVSLHP